MSGCGLAPPFSYSACYRAPKCDLFSSNWKYDPHLAQFCKKFGHNQPKICPQVLDPCESIHEPLRSLDYFSSPPMYRRNICTTKFRYPKSTFEPDKCQGKCKTSCSSSLGIPQFASSGTKPHGDTVCGFDIPNKTLHNPDPLSFKNNTIQNYDYGEMPFTIHFTDPMAVNNEPKTRKVNSQVERCIHISSKRYLDTVYKDEFLDFYKIKSKEHMNLYRTRLAIEKRRPRPTIPIDSIENKPLDMNQPIYITAKVIRMKNKGNGNNNNQKSYQVCVPGPITIG